MTHVPATLSSSSFSSALFPIPSAFDDSAYVISHSHSSSRRHRYIDGVELPLFAFRRRNAVVAMLEDAPRPDWSYSDIEGMMIDA